MYIELPKKIRKLTTEPTFPVENPLGRISSFKGGVFVYNLKGDLMGQVVAQKEGVRVTIGDGGSWDISEKNKNTVTIKDAVLPNKKPSDCAYIFFGNADTYQFSLFKKTKGIVKPENVAECGEHYFKKDVYCMQTDDNPILMVLFCLAIDYLHA